MDLAARPAGYTELSPRPESACLCHRARGRARTSLTVALRAILDPPLRATAALIERPGRENVRLGPN